MSKVKQSTKKLEDAISRRQRSDWQFCQEEDQT